MIAKVMVDFRNQNFLLKYFSLPKKKYFLCQQTSQTFLDNYLSILLGYQIETKPL